MRRFFSLVPLLIGWLAIATLAHAEKRVALVIGNGAYQHVANLPNPPRDAIAIGDMFKAAGFDEVIVKTDLGNSEMRADLREFARKSVGADIAAVFYAGHGIEVGGRNYLVPVDAKVEYDTDVEDEAVDLDRVLQQLEPAKRLKLVILDACRDNPFPHMKSLSQSRSVGRGLCAPSATGCRYARRLRCRSWRDRGGRRRRAQPVHVGALEQPHATRARHTVGFRQGAR